MPHQCTECSRTFPDGSKQMLAGCPDCGGNKFQFRPKGSVSVPENRPPEPEVPESRNRSKSTDPGKTRTTTLREWARKVTPGSGTADAAVSSQRGESTANARPTANSGSTATERASSAGTSRSESSRTDAEGSTATTKLESFTDTAEESSDTRSSDATSTGDARPTDGPGSADAGPTNHAGPTDDAEAVETADHEDSAQADARSGVVGEHELPERPTDGEEVRPPEDDAPGSDEPRPDLAQLREELNDQFESIKVVEPGQYELNLMELYDREEYIIALQENGRYVIEVPDAWDAVDT